MTAAAPPVRGRRGARGASGRSSALTVSLLMALAGCASDAPRIVEAYGDPASPRLELSVDTCNRTPRATVVESDTEVRITIEADEPSGDGSGDCLDRAEVTLGQPLGRRTVVDEGSDRTVTVRPAEG